MIARVIAGVLEVEADPEEDAEDGLPAGTGMGQAGEGANGAGPSNQPAASPNSAAAAPSNGKAVCRLSTDMCRTLLELIQDQKGGEGPAGQPLSYKHEFIKALIRWGVSSLHIIRFCCNIKSSNCLLRSLIRQY